MFSQAELVDAISELLDGKHSIQTCEKLASVYTVLDHLYGPQAFVGQSNDSKIETETIIGSYGDSQFLRSIEGLPSDEVWLLVDELIEAVSVLNPRLASSFFDKLSDL